MRKKHLEAEGDVRSRVCYEDLRSDHWDPLAVNILQKVSSYYKFIFSEIKQIINLFFVF